MLKKLAVSLNGYQSYQTQYAAITLAMTSRRACNFGELSRPPFDVVALVEVGSGAN